ncbi:unnamed protein product [Calicophoron daubneyi]|uniref:Post-SET domain-containing protein n=1 Tax=Calicophoron daubneyi TaxID=300641 RepID=A0AAV2TVN7_CALDB
MEIRSNTNSSCAVDRPWSADFERTTPIICTRMSYFQNCSHSARRKFHPKDNIAIRKVPFARNSSYRSDYKANVEGFVDVGEYVANSRNDERKCTCGAQECDKMPVSHKQLIRNLKTFI